MKNNNNFTQWKNWSVEVSFTCAIAHQKHFAQSGRSTRSAVDTWQVEQKPGGRGRGREWAILGVHPLSWLLSNNWLEKVPFVSVPHTSSNRLLLSNQTKDVPLVLLILLLFLLAPLCSTSGFSIHSAYSLKSQSENKLECMIMM